MTEVARDLGLEEAKEQITARGRERGFVTSDDLLESVPVEDFTPEQVEEFLTQVEEHLRGEGIEVIEVPGDEVDGSAQRQLDVDLLKAPTNDPVRMYLKEIGKVPLLTAAQEVDLARRIEAGEFATELRELTEEEDRVDQKRLRLVTESVVAIRDHQVEKFGKVEGIGRDRIAQDLQAEDARGARRLPAPRRTRRTAREAQADRGEPAPRGLDREAVRRPRDAVPRPDPGGQPRADPRGREVRLLEGVQVLDVRDVVDPPGHHPRHRRPGPHDPHPGAHGRDDQQARPHPAPAPPGPRPRAAPGGDRAGRWASPPRRFARS